MVAIGTPDDEDVAIARDQTLRSAKPSTSG